MPAIVINTEHRFCNCCRFCTALQPAIILSLLNLVRYDVVQLFFIRRPLHPLNLVLSVTMSNASMLSWLLRIEETEVRSGCARVQAQLAERSVA